MRGSRLFVRVSVSPPPSASVVVPTDPVPLPEPPDNLFEVMDVYSVPSVSMKVSLLSEYIGMGESQQIIRVYQE